MIAPLSGRITVGRSAGRGKNILITRADGLSCRLAHLDEILVKNGAVVSQGDAVGREGNSGGVQGHSCRQHPGTHIHMACYRNRIGVPPEPISGYTGMNRLISRTLVPKSPPILQPALTAALHPVSGSPLR